MARPPVGTTLHPDRKAAIPSLMKWTGSKRSQARAIFANFPKFRGYFEPFLGGGALLYLAAGGKAVAGDLYTPLIDFWRAVQHDPDAMIENYARQWALLQADTPAYFYQVRDRFNAQPNGPDLCFLMRTCVNGIIRLNDAGAFNNSFHLSRAGMRPGTFAIAVRKWSVRLKGVEFLIASYERTIERAARGDMVYLDPPYAGNQQRYTADLDLKQFWLQLEALNRRGVNWALSFDGGRGSVDLSHPVPVELYRRRLLLSSGNSAVGKVLGGKLERVTESLYLNYMPME